MSTLLKLALLLPFWFAAHGAPAMTTLTYTWSNIDCGIVNADSTRSSLPCTAGSGPSFASLAQPGQSVFVTATLNYTYHDDGLALEPRGFFQLDPFGLRIRYVDHEAAGFSVRANGCFSRSCNQPPEQTDTFSGPYTTVLGDNDVPDDLSGQIVFSSTAGVQPSWPGAETRTAFLSVFDERVFSGVSPAPEPASFLLLGAGLLLLGMAARRQRGSTLVVCPLNCGAEVAQSASR
jgi:PEP-CTERM motif